MWKYNLIKKTIILGSFVCFRGQCSRTIQFTILKTSIWNYWCAGEIYYGIVYVKLTMWMHWFGFLAALPRGMYDLSAPITVQFVHPKIKTVQTICKNMEKRRIECCSHLQRTYHGRFASPVARGWCWSRHLCFLSTLSCAATRPHYMSPLVANIRLITSNLTLKLRGRGSDCFASLWK